MALTRTQKALWLSAFIHLVAMLFLPKFISPSPSLPPEQLLQVTLIDIPTDPPQKVSSSLASTTPQATTPQNTATPKANKSPAASPNTRQKKSAVTTDKSARITDDSNYSYAPTSNKSSYGYSPTATNEPGAGSIDGASSAPKPGSMGYEAATAIHTVVPSAQSSSGTTYVRIQVDSTGSIISCEVAQSSGNTTLDRAALTAARQSTFHPAKDIATGENVASTILLPFLFKPPTDDEDSLW